MKKIISAAVFIGAVLQADAQKDTSYWTRGIETGFTLANSTFSPNWRGGGVNNFTATAFFNAAANYKKAKISWDNKLNTLYGVIRTMQNDQNNEQYASVKKAMDNLLVDSKFGYALSPKINAYGGITLQTQLLPGFNYLKNSIGRDSAIRISSFLSQGMLVEALGFEYKPWEWAFARVGLGATKQTFVLDQALYQSGDPNEVLYGVKKGQKVRNDLGIQLQAGINKDLDKKKNMNLKVNYLGFYSYGTPNSPLDSRVDLIYTAKITKYITFNYTLIAIFDKDQREPGLNAWQNSQVMGIGVMYKF